MSAPHTRRVLALADSGHAVLATAPSPPVGPGELRIAVRASALSAGTELGRFVGRERPAAPVGEPRPFGYQVAGVVTALGPGCRGFAVGQRVAAMGAGRALHADAVVVPQNLAVPLPDAVSFADAAFVALGATALQAARRGEVSFGEEVGVVGLGMVGQLVARVCRIAGARVWAADPLPRREAAARAGGVHAAASLEQIDAPGWDAAFLCVGGEATAALEGVVGKMRRAPDTHRSGRIVLVGGASVTHAFGAALGNLDLRSAARTGPGYHDPDWERGADYPQVFVRWGTDSHLRLFVRWLAEGVLRIDDLVTHRVPLDAGPDLCAALIDDPGAFLGVVLEP